MRHNIKDVQNTTVNPHLFRLIDYQSRTLFYFKFFNKNKSSKMFHNPWEKKSKLLKFDSFNDFYIKEHKSESFSMRSL